MNFVSTIEPKPKILVVEDDKDIQTLLATLLTRRGYRVERADSGLSALASFSQSIPDLILLDLAMPDMDGLTFLKRRSQFEETKNIPLIVISARGRDSDVRASVEAGANSYITKPFDHAQLIASIAGLLAAQPDAPSQAQDGSVFL